MTLKADEFTLVRAQAEAQQPKKKQINVVKKAKKASGGPRARLDLRGKRYEEAMQELDAFIDQALLNNMSQVDIIHGIGTGVIRDAAKILTVIAMLKVLNMPHKVPVVPDVPLQP